MEQSSFLQTCKSCGEGFAKAVKVCPHCGKKSQSSTLLMVIVGIGCLALAAAFALPAGKSQSGDMEAIVAAPVDTVDVAELAAVLKGQKAPNDPYVIKQAHKITGKIVQWELEVFVCTNSKFSCQLVSNPAPQVPGALVMVYPGDDKQKIALQNVKPGDRIRVKGVIKGIQGGRVRIDPAIIL